MREIKIIESLVTDKQDKTFSGTSTKPFREVYLVNKGSLHSKVSNLPGNLKFTPNKSIFDIKSKI